jgi:hypothetical protein
MIEFKADCGHTIRAKDGDEGKVVRCSYCGRTTQVPDKAEDEFASLFSDVVDLEAGESVSAGEAVKLKRRRPATPAAKPRRKRETGSGFNPFAVVLKMTYAAVIVIVLIVCAKAGYDYLRDRPDREDQRRVERPPDGGRNTPQPNTGGRQPGGRLKPGPQITLPKNFRGNDGGIYVRSVPDKAEVRYRRLSDSHDQEEIFLDPEAQTKRTPCIVQLDAGEWEVAVGLRIDSPQLHRYPKYTDQRAYAEATDSVQPLDGFFSPDQANEMALVFSPQGYRIVVRKYECHVIKKDWLQLTALFVPNVPLEDLLPLLPTEKFFGFDETYVITQLTYHGVPEEDHAMLIDALQRVGTVVYHKQDKNEYCCFSIGLEGQLNQPPIEVRQGGW